MKWILVVMYVLSDGVGFSSNAMVAGMYQNKRQCEVSLATAKAMGGIPKEAILYRHSKCIEIK